MCSRCPKACALPSSLSLIPFYRMKQNQNTYSAFIYDSNAFVVLKATSNALSSLSLDITIQQQRSLFVERKAREGSLYLLHCDHRRREEDTSENHNSNKNELHCKTKQAKSKENMNSKMNGEVRKPSHFLHPSQNGELSNPSGTIHQSSIEAFHVTTADSASFPDSTPNRA